MTGTTGGGDDKPSATKATGRAKASTAAKPRRSRAKKPPPRNAATVPATHNRRKPKPIDPDRIPPAVVAAMGPPVVGPLDNGHDERIARLVAKGSTLAAAYREVHGQSGASSTITTMSKRIQARVAELKHRWALAADIDTARLIAWNVEALELARSLGMPAAMTAATKEIGTLLGLREERHRVAGGVTVQHEGGPAELARSLAALLGDVMRGRQGGPVIDAEPAGCIEANSPSEENQ